MPSLMIHLKCAHALGPNAPAPFFVGSVAPDAAGPWKEKDRTHFRDLADRAPAFEKLALATDPKQPFQEGVLLHLYTDWRWDVLALERYRRAHGEGWFLPYREEIALAGAWIYHHSDWSAALWRKMLDCPVSEYGETDGASPEGVRALIVRNAAWYAQNDVGPSAFFTPGFVDAFCETIVCEYARWRGR